MKKVNKLIVGRGLIDPSKAYMTSESQETLNDWTGGDFYNRLWKMDLFGLRLVLWKRH